MVLPPDDRPSRYHDLLAKLPDVNRHVVKHLLFLLMQVSINSEINKMTSQNLATVFGHMAGIFANNSGELVKWLIENYFVLYEVCCVELPHIVAHILDGRLETCGV